jgi:hypothetical protein
MTGCAAFFGTFDAGRKGRVKTMHASAMSADTSSAMSIPREVRLHGREHRGGEHEEVSRREPLQVRLWRVQHSGQSGQRHAEHVPLTASMARLSAPKPTV